MEHTEGHKECPACLDALMQIPAPIIVRKETGPMQIGGDWPGVFIRGDDTLAFSAAINRLFKRELHT